VLVLAALVSGCSTLPSTKTELPKAAIAAVNLNPEVTPPKAQIQVAANLPVVEAPAGFITGAEARDKAVAAMQRREWGGLLLLTDLHFDAANKVWEASFQTDGRIPGRPGSHPAEHRSDDPIEQRKLGHSWISVAGALDVTIDGVTGELRGGGFHGGKLQPDRPDLEHYRGRIITGGEVLKLRLTQADDTPTGRELEVWVPQALLGDKLALWQLQYGQGRTVEVWGLTNGPGVVLAHRITMTDPPPESLLAAPLVDDLPLYPGAYLRPSDGRKTVIQAQGADPTQVRDWYVKQLPLYGWKPGTTPDIFETAAWAKVRLDVTPTNDGVQVTFTQIG
jgi:hypothetical protein